jgi:hypothetical protein
LKQSASNPSISINDSRKLMVVNDPSIANAFLIDHDWYRHTKKDCGGAVWKHMKPIIENVIDHQPYFNRSQGRDHFYMAVYDRGPFCDMQCVRTADERKIIERLENASYIGNYGMDRLTFYYPNSNEIVWKYKRLGRPCHRAGQDIVIPQLLLPQTAAMHKKYRQTHLPYREFDSSFAGNAWGERAPVREMGLTMMEDYEKFATERYQHLMGGSPDHSLKFRGYFMYNPCGHACWSQRLYEALAVYTIPIIVTDGGIQAFERFIDWRTISVKMNLQTWTNKTLLANYRKQIRIESDLFRNKLASCGSKLQPALRGFDFNDQFTWFEAARNGNISECLELFDTFYWKKSEMISQASEWFDFSEIKESRIHAFRLLTMEIFCHAMAYLNRDIAICNRPADFTARLEYFY